MGQNRELVYRDEIWRLVGDMAETVRPGSKLDGVMQRYASAIDGAQAVEAIPAEWIRNMMLEREAEESRAAWLVLREWHKEKEAEK